MLLLQKVFDMMRVFEAYDALIECIVPEITDLLLFLERQADRTGGGDVFGRDCHHPTRVLLED
jgi:hypothetical protein